MNEEPNSFDDIPGSEDDSSLPPEEQAEMEKHEAEFGAAIESELCEEFGPPDVREAKTAAYCAKLCKRWGEPQIRGLLLRMAENPDTLAVQMLLETCDLVHDPLTRIIRPYDHLGFHLEIKPADDDPSLLSIEFGRAYQLVGDGCIWSARVNKGGSIQVIDDEGRWIC